MKPKNLLVLAPDFPDESNGHISGVFVKEQVRYLRKYFDNIYVISPTSIWKEYLIKKHYENYSWDNVHVFYPMTINIPFPYVPKRLKKLWVYIEMNRILKTINFENITFSLIHAHYTWYPGVVAVELKKKFNVPVIITEHTSVTLQKALKKKDPYHLKTWEKCDAIIRVNNKDVSLLMKFNKNIISIPNGFDEKKFYRMNRERCRDKLNLPLDVNIIITIGSLFKVKGYEYSIEAISHIIKKRKDILYIIIGSGPLKNTLSRKIIDLDLKNYIKIIDFVPHADLPALINACNLFVLSSLNEGNPTVMFECLGCGKPFIGTNVGGIPEIITSEDYGYLIEPRNSEALAERILWALEKEWDEEHISRYAKQFTWNKISERIVEVYKIGAEHEPF